MNANGARPYCRLPLACAAGTRGRCRVCHGKRERADAIVARWDNGTLTIKAVASYFGISPQRVRVVLQQAGVKAGVPRFRSRKELTADQYRRFRSMCTRGIPAAMAHEEVRR